MQKHAMCYKAYILTETSKDRNDIVAKRSEGSRIDNETKRLVTTSYGENSVE